MPFVTEEIWEKLTGRSGTLIVSPFPVEDVSLSDPAADKIVGALRELVTRVRNFRTDRGVSPSEPVELWIDPHSPDSSLAGEIERLGPLLRHMARLSGLSPSEPPATGARDVVAGLAIGLALPARVAAADSARQNKTLEKLSAEIEELQAKVRNPSFVDRAPASVVEKTRQRLDELEKRRAALSPDAE
jgi:valyl-tRNA synthetase